MIESKWMNSRDKILTHSCMAHETEQFEQEAKIAISLIERWGVVAAVPDGEDSVGRAKLRLQTPAELVDRAFETASLAMLSAREYGLIHNVGSIPPVREDESSEAVHDSRSRDLFND